MTEQLTFSAEEAKVSANFFNFVFTHATWDGLESRQVIELAKLFAGYAPLQKKIDAHVMELVKVTDPQKPKRTRKKAKA